MVRGIKLPPPAGYSTARVASTTLAIGAERWTVVTSCPPNVSVTLPIRSNPTDS